MAIKITSTGQTTFVKEIRLGAPVSNIREAQGIFNTNEREHGDILIYDSGEGFYKTGPLVGGTGISVTHSADSDNLTLENTLFPTSFLFDDNIGEITLNRADGSQIEVVIGLGAFTTDDLVEGSNLYYTTSAHDSDFDVRLAIQTTDNINEGATNLYYTDARVDSHLSSGLVEDIQTSGNVIIGGDLTVQGETTTLNTTELTVEDKNIILADGALDSLSADQGGITLAGANATLLYDHINSKWKINRGLIVEGDLVPSADITYDLGSSSAKWKDLHLSGSTIFLGGLKIQDSGSQLIVKDSADAVVEFNLSGSQDQIRGFFGASGDLSYDSSTGVFSFDVEQVYTKANFDSDFNSAIDEAALGGTGLSYDSSTNTLSITDTGVSAGTYGSASEVPVFTVNAQGQLDSAGVVSVAGVSSTSYDSATGVFTINTADGGTFATTFHDSDDRITEIRTAISGGGDLTYNSSTGEFTIDVEQIYTKANFDSDLGDASTSDLPEGTNLYYTTSRADSDFDIRLAAKSTSDVSEGTNLYYTTARFDSDFSDNTTSDLAEGSNLYYTTARADSDAKNAISVTDAGGDGSLSYSAANGEITYTGPSASEVRAHFSNGTGVTITSGEIAIGQDVGTTSDVTFAKITGDSAVINGVSFNATPGTYAGGNTPGTLFWDSDEQKGLSFVTRTLEGFAGATINVGQENVIYVHNQTGETVSNGDVVYISGTAHGLHPSITKAQANVAVSGNIAIATHDIVDNAHGYVTTFGLVRDVNTDGLVAGDDIYLSKDSAGKWTTTEVSIDEGYPYHVGKVVRVDASTGTILVNPFREHLEYLRLEDQLRVDGAVRGDSFSVGEIAFRTDFVDSHIDFQEGALWYDPLHKNLNYYTDFDHPIEIGMQIVERVYNNTGSTILKGQPLYYSGNRTDVAGQESPTVALANATSSTKYNVQGLAAEDIPINSYGQIVVAGVIDGFDTSGLNAGQNFFAGLTDGAVQNAPPTYPNYPMCLGWVIKSDATNGKVIINQQNHSVNSFRVQGNTHISANLVIDGDLTVAGTQTITSTENVQIGGNIQYLNAGNTIGEAGTNFSGSGLDDAFFAGHYSGDSSTKQFYVEIDSAGATDTFEWGFDSLGTPEATGVVITGAEQELAAGIKIDFGATTGHTLGDKWTGTAAATNVDTGLFSNKNEGDGGNGYTHVGVYWDATENEWTFVGQYDSEPEAPIDRSAPTFQYGDVRGKDFYGTTFNGALSGNASTATALASAQNFSLTGDITATAVSFNGTGAVQLTTAYNPGSIVNDDINASAGIVDTKLATISTAGKVQNSATTATSVNTASAIVARDASGNFTAGTITATLSGNASTADSADDAGALNGQTAAYYLNYNNFTNTPYIPAYGTDYIDSVYVTGLPVSTFTNDANYLDSTTVQDVINTAYIQANQKNYIDSALAEYRFMDSNEVIGLVDSAYVQARQDFAYGSLTGTPTNVSAFTNDANYLDSTTVTGVIDATYIQSNQTTYNTSNFTDSAFVTGLPISTFTNDANYLDSVTATSLFDSAYVQARQADIFRDSAFVKTVNYLDNEKLSFGSKDSGGDLKIYHNGSNSFIQETGAGRLILDTNGPGVTISRGTNSEAMAVFNINAEVGLFYDNVKKFETTATGITVTGEVIADSATISGPVSTGALSASSLSVTQGEFSTQSYGIQTNKPMLSLDASLSGTAVVSGGGLSVGPGFDGNVYLSGQYEDDSALYAGIRSFYDAAPTPTGWGEVLYNKSTRLAATSTGIDVTGEVVADSATIAGLNYPTADGTTGQFLKTDGSGNLSFDTVVAGGGGGLDSDLIEGMVDSAYVIARAGSLIISSYEYTATAGQTSFTGSDDNTNTLSYTIGYLDVYLNGVLLSDTIDYTADDGLTITLETSADSNDFLTAKAFSANAVPGVSQTLIDGFTTTSAVIDSTGGGILTSYSAAAYRTQKHIIDIQRGGAYQSQELLITHNGSDAFITSFAVITAQDSNLGTFDAIYNSGAVEVKFYPSTTATHTVKSKYTSTEV